MLFLLCCKDYTIRHAIAQILLIYQICDQVTIMQKKKGMRNENKNLCNPGNISYRITNLRTHKIHRKFLRAEDIKDHLKQVDQSMQHGGVMK